MLQCGRDFTGMSELVHGEQDLDPVSQLCSPPHCTRVVRGRWERATHTVVRVGNSVTGHSQQDGLGRRWGWVEMGRPGMQRPEEAKKPNGALTGQFTGEESKVHSPVSSVIQLRARDCSPLVTQSAHASFTDSLAVVWRMDWLGPGLKAERSGGSGQPGDKDPMCPERKLKEELTCQSDIGRVGEINSIWNVITPDGVSQHLLWAMCCVCIVSFNPQDNSRFWALVHIPGFHQELYMNWLSQLPYELLSPTLQKGRQNFREFK